MGNGMLRIDTLTVGFGSQENLDALVEEMGKAPQKALQYTLKDLKKGIPGWATGAVTKRYTIKKTEVMGRTDAVRIHVEGDTAESVSVVYKGRTLTPIHFQMSPQKPSKQKLKSKRAIPGINMRFAFGKKSPVGMVTVYRKYKIRVGIERGQRKTLQGKYETTPFLAPVKRGSNTYIPFQRLRNGAWGDRTDMVSVRTASIPQMIGNEDVIEEIREKIEERTATRLAYHIARFAR